MDRLSVWRRPTRANTELVRVVLDRLAATGADWSPRFLGVEGGEECLSWIPGGIRDDWAVRPDRLDTLARLVRRLHDVTVGLVPGTECIVHDDLQPRNVVVGDGEFLGLIDWEQLRPGRRVEDVAQLCWSFSPPGYDDVLDVAARWHRILDAYGFSGRDEVVAASLAKLDRCVDDIVRRAANGSAKHAGFVARGDHRELGEIRAWLASHGPALTHGLVALAGESPSRHA